MAAYFPAQTLVYCVCCLSGFVWVGLHWDIRLKTARKSILLVTHSWINHSLWLWPINRQRGAGAPGWTLGEQLGETANWIIVYHQSSRSLHILSGISPSISVNLSQWLNTNQRHACAFHEPGEEVRLAGVSQTPNAEKNNSCIDSETNVRLSPDSSCSADAQRR